MARDALDMPPLLRHVAPPEGVDAFEHACAIAGAAGAGTLAWRRAADVCAFAVVLEPEGALAEARRAFFATMAALGDALAAHCAPERLVTFLWPDTVLYDAARLGGARLAQRFVHHDPPRSEELEALMQSLQRAWMPTARALRRHRWSLALGSSATIYQLMLAAYLRQHPRPPKEKQRLSVTRASLKRLLQWLAVSTAAQRIQLAGVDPRREDLVLTTGLALLEWMEQCGVSSIRYAPGSLREGLVMDYLIRHHERQARVISALLPDAAGGNGRALSLPWRTPLVRRLRRDDRQAFLKG